MKRKTLLYSYLISITINLTLMLTLSFFSEHPPIQLKKDDVNIQFVSLPKAQVLQRRSVSMSKQTDPSESFSNEKRLSNAKYLTTRTYRTIVRELAPKSNDPDFIESMSEFDLEKMPSPRFRHGSNIDGSPMGASGSRSRSGSSSSKANPGQTGGNIKPEEARASISGSGDEMEGFYNMSLIRYEDSSDSVSTDALHQLAGAMNRWTKVKTQVIKKPMRLDDSRLVSVPLIYITSRRPFAFSERERQNLRRFFANDGFMIFSNVAESDTQRLEVANSIGFELWKILGESARDLMELDRSDIIYDCFFDLHRSPLSDILGITIDDRIIMIYEDSGYAKAWVSGKSGKNDPYLEMGVNIIAYALTTNPGIR